MKFKSFENPYSNSYDDLKSCFNEIYLVGLNKFLDKEKTKDFTASIYDYHCGDCSDYDEDDEDYDEEEEERRYRKISLKPLDLMKYMDNNSILIVNWGHYSYNTCSMSNELRELFSVYRTVCFDDIFFAKDLSVGNENGLVEFPVDLGKKTEPLMTVCFDKKTNKYIFYLLYDSIHHGTQDEADLFSRLLLCAAKTNQLEIFDSGVVIEALKLKNSHFSLTKPFKSIVDAVAEKNLKKEEIMEEMINKVDLDRIMNIVNAHIGYQQKRLEKQHKQRVSKDKIRIWLKKWAELKYPFYVLFGRQFFIKKHIKYIKDNIAFKTQINDLCNKYPKYVLVLKSFPLNDFIDNSMTQIYGDLEQYVTWKKGMKLSKFLSQLLEDEKFDIDLSKVLQDKYIEQNLYISIDPYDFLTSAINKSGWRSCHNFENGEHASGSASYMFDESTLIAYMCSDKEYEYDINNNKFKGNSKNWRQHIYVDTVDNRCIFSRQYPQDYFNNEVADATRGMLEEKISEFCDIDNIWLKSSNKENRSVDYEYPYSMAYNDIPRNSTVMIRHKAQPETTHRTMIGGEVMCPICNKYNNNFYNHTILCDEIRCEHEEEEVVKKNKKDNELNSSDDVDSRWGIPSPSDIYTTSVLAPEPVQEQLVSLADMDYVNRTMAGRLTDFLEVYENRSYFESPYIAISGVNLLSNIEEIDDDGGITIRRTELE